MRQKGGRQSSLTSLVNKQLMEEVDLPVCSREPAKSGGKKYSVDPLIFGKTCVCKVGRRRF